MTEQGKEHKAINKYLQPAFLICVFVLAIAGFSMSYAINRFGVYLKKEPLALKKSLDLMDENGLGDYEVVKKYKIENEEVIQSLGTEDYIQWQLKDMSEDVADNARNCFLFITYYDLPDQVPHVPEECYAGGGYQRLSSESINLAIEEGKRDISARYLIFSGTNAFGLETKFSAFYLFSVNGVYADDRQEVRTALNKNIFGKHSYFCKVEWWFFDENTGGKSYLSEDEAKVAGQKLLNTILPILEQEHLAEWNK